MKDALPLKSSNIIWVRKEQELVKRDQAENIEEKDVTYDKLKQSESC